MSTYILFFFLSLNSVFSAPQNEHGLEIDMTFYIDTISAEDNVISLAEDSSEVEYHIQFYYESLSFNSWLLYTFFIAPVQARLDSRIAIETYPYGIARTYNDGNQYKFKCEHGPKECYGNKLHACTLHLLKNKSDAILFNLCLINKQSNDTAVNECGEKYNVLAEPIIECAKSRLGSKLLKHYGDESKKVDYKEVPYVLINGEPMLPNLHRQRDSLLAGHYSRGQFNKRQY